MPKTPEEIVMGMYNHDPFSQLLGISIIQINEGSCSLSLKVTSAMLNGFGIAHGGITYALADSALAFASNSRGIQSVSIDTSINHLLAVNEGDELFAHTQELNLTNRTGLYLIEIRNQHQKKVALFKGTVYRTGKEW